MKFLERFPSKVGAFVILLGIGILIVSVGMWFPDYFSDAYFDHSPPYFYLSLPAAFFLYFGIRLQFGKPIGSYCRLVGWLVFPMALPMSVFLSSSTDMWLCLSIETSAFSLLVIFASVLGICPVYAATTRFLMRLDGATRPLRKELFSKGGIDVLSIFLFLCIVGDGSLKADHSILLVVFLGKILVSYLFYQLALYIAGHRAKPGKGNHQNFRPTRS